jgi:flagellar motor switch protein FliG
MDKRNTPLTKRWRQLLLSSLLLGALWMPTATAQDGAPDTGETAAEQPAQAAPTSEPAAVTTATSRPLSAYERFGYESVISNQLQGLLGRYLSPTLFHLSVEVTGKVTNAQPVGSTGGSGRGRANIDATVKGTPSNSEFTEEDKTLEMLPALPFFSSRLRAPVTVDANDQEADVAPSNNPSPGGGGGLAPAGNVNNGPSIDRIRVFLAVDSTVSPSSAEFYRNLISNTLRLDARKGDNIVLTVTDFPKEEKSPSNNSVTVNARLEQNPENQGAMMSMINDLGNNLSLILGIGLGLVGLLIFIGLVWRQKKGAEALAAAVAGNKSSDSMGAGMGEGAGYNGQMNGMAMNGMSPIQMQTEMVMHQDQQQADLRASDPLMDWLINDRTNLAFTFERWSREQGANGIQKMVMLLYPYGNHFLDMLTELLEPKTAHAVDLAWRRWSPESLDSAAQKRALDELVLAMRNQRQFGNFPFVIYLKDDEIAALLEDEPAINCLMVLEGLSAARKSVLMNMFGVEKASDILSSYPALAAIRFDEYAELSTNLFKKLKEIRESKGKNVEAFKQVLSTIEQQSISQQEEMLDKLRDSNRELYAYVREHITLWSDIPEIADEVLQQAMAALDSDSVAALISSDTALQERLLPFRAPREQLLIKDLLSQGNINAGKTEKERREFLLRVRQLKQNTPALEVAS